MPQYFPPQPGGNATTLDISTATVLKSAPGRVYVVSVVTAGSAPGAIYDSASTTGNTAANQIGVIPLAVGTYYFYGIPTVTGIVVSPPTSTGVVSVSWA